jgi:hypothetical protein
MQLNYEFTRLFDFAMRDTISERDSSDVIASTAPPKQQFANDRILASVTSSPVPLAMSFGLSRPKVPLAMSGAICARPSPAATSLA